MTFPIVVPVLAALAWAFAGGSMAKAVRLLVLYCKALPVKLPANPGNFIKYWRGRLKRGGYIDSHAHNAGRPASVTPRMVTRAYNGIINWKAAGRRRPYASRKDLEQNCPEVRQVLQESGVTIDTLIRKIKRAHPHFQFKKLRVRWELTEGNKQQRVNICTELLQYFRNLLHRVVFVDAKTIWMWEEEVKGWVDTSVFTSTHGIKPAYSQGKVIHLKYYAAVHNKLGPVWIRFYTGTTGMPHNRDGHNYRVSSRDE
jgi:hypothetical protein